ncbi:cysteinyl-tRNA synthetase [Kribbella flavida DSM 17836]|uniref:Cysteine--tRNA ligase n=1 Tax=Kribbella flavida (strain DSM 17836 / JCM 10339 / NBRC 14399) TaxID=479435 RepID=D2Q1F2_KRIFD|nr:cysteine--tRNA ligase [Kribbella flavida]ADB30140.1 cysteinyl-tRNA synthetase [Kribbella flavida DSM 17836]
MTLRLYDTATAAVRDFVPVHPGKVGIYHCGLTVQGAPHVGHIYKEVVFDVLRRWLERSGYQVTVIANVTDIEDKILAKSAEREIPWWAHAYEFERELHWAYDVLGCRPPTYEPRATGHIPEMLEMIQQLIDGGHAYVAQDGSGDVYFDVKSWPAYGELSNQKIDDMEAAEDADPRGKRDPRDFALWKGHTEGVPLTASWPTPWGRGRPGWHLECSAMAGKYLGGEFDIHGGGLDLRFPHHENELAQSTAVGQKFARFWMHNALVTAAGEKMSKSLGNGAIVRNVVERVRPIELRFYLVQSHYRSVVEFSFGALDEAATSFQRIEGFVTRATELTGAADRVDPAAVELPADFVAAMDDDLGTPAAMAVLHTTVRDGNKLLADGDSPALRETLATVRSMLDVFGLDPLAEPWVSRTGTTDELTEVVDGLVQALLDQRQAARERKDYAASDQIRDRLKALGVVVEDTPQGPRWTIAPKTTEGN